MLVIMLKVGHPHFKTLFAPHSLRQHTQTHPLGVVEKRKKQKKRKMRDEPKKIYSLSHFGLPKLCASHTCYYCYGGKANIGIQKGAGSKLKTLYCVWGLTWPWTWA